MYCRKCGKEIKDDAAFCPYCGAPVNAAAQQPGQSQTRPDVSVQNRVRYNMPGADSASWVTDSFGGTLFLLISILMTCYLAMYLFGNFGMTRVLLAVPRLFICIGCWMLYSSCHNGRPESTGFTLIQGGLIALLILYCIPAIILCIGCGSESGFSSVFVMIMACAVFLLIPFIIALIIGAVVWCVTAVIHRDYDDAALHAQVVLTRHICILLIIPFEVYVLISVIIERIFLDDIIYIMIWFISALVLLNVLLFFVWRAPVKELGLCRKYITGEPAENENNTSLLAIIDLCCFLVLYIIQFFMIVYLQGILGEMLSLIERYLGDMSIVSDGMSSLINNTVGQTIAGLFLIVLLACVVALLFSIRTKSKSYEGQD